MTEALQEFLIKRYLKSQLSIYAVNRYIYFKVRKKATSCSKHILLDAARFLGLPLNKIDDFIRFINPDSLITYNFKDEHIVPICILCGFSANCVNLKRIDEQHYISDIYQITLFLLSWNKLFIYSQFFDTSGRMCQEICSDLFLDDITTIQNVDEKLAYTSKDMCSTHCLRIILPGEILKFAANDTCDDATSFVCSFQRLLLYVRRISPQFEPGYHNDQWYLKKLRTQYGLII